MNKFKTNDFSIIIGEILFSILFVIWLFIPQVKIKEELLAPIQWQKILDNNILFYFLYLIPVIFIYKLISLFLYKKIPLLFKPNTFLSVILNLINSGLILLFFGSYTIKYAENIRFFYEINIIFYFFIIIALVYNGYYYYKIIKVLFYLDPSYNDYKNVLKTEYLNEQDEEHNVKIKSFISIRQKTIMFFIITMLIVIMILTYLLLADYRRTILESIEYTGKTLTEQSATFLKQKFEDDIELSEYIFKEGKRNLESEFKYDSLSFIMKVPKTNKYIYKFSTNKNELNKELSETELNKYLNLKTPSIKEKNIYNFIFPVAVSNKIIGFSIVKYNEDIIYKPFFQALLRSIFITIIVLYISLIFIILFGNKIVFPILYLQTNVKVISNILLNMVKGKLKKSANLLNYEEKVRSKDEIKTLSIAVDEMVKVIKGIIPYISSSTLTYADKATKSIQTEMAFLFTDIRGFTTMCEGMQPDEVVNILNRYLDLQTEIIHKYNGDIDKFVGDEIMAAFDGPEKEINACRAALEIIAAMKEEKEKREKENKPTVTIGIGINSGIVVFGNVGAKERMDFTSIGDTVNLAARLEGTNKEYKTDSLISESVYEKVKDHFLCREIDLVAVKGKTKPVKIFELICEIDKATKEQNDLKLLFEAGLNCYKLKQWDKAIEHFKKSLEQFQDKTSEVFIQRINYFKNNPPPENWDGVFTMKVK